MLTLRHGDAAARAVIGPPAKTWSRTKTGSRLHHRTKTGSRLRRSVCVVLSLRRRGTIISPYCACNWSVMHTKTYTHAHRWKYGYWCLWRNENQNTRANERRHTRFQCAVRHSFLSSLYVRTRCNLAVNKINAKRRFSTWINMETRLPTQCAATKHFIICTNNAFSMEAQTQTCDIFLHKCIYMTKVNVLLKHDVVRQPPLRMKWLGCLRHSISSVMCVYSYI